MQNQIETQFKDYALDQRVKYASSQMGLLSSNRVKLWECAYRPLSVLLNSATSVLDYGCGTGDFLKFLRGKTKALLVGFDPSKSQIEIANHKKIENVVFLDEPSWSHYLDHSKVKSFDVVFSNHVLEHIPDHSLSDYVAILCSKVSKEGTLVITTPNGLNPFAYTYYMSTDRTHLRMHSPMTLAELLRPHGFEITQVGRESPHAYDFSSALKTLVWWITTFWMKLVTASVAPGMRGVAFPLNFSGSFFIVAKRKGSLK